MSWRDQMRPGSFRGAAFAIRLGDGEGGRRGEHHEFPGRDTPWFEDLGRAARRWTIEAIVIGRDYMADRDALIVACDAKGAGSLVHPFLGTFDAVCQSYRFSETTAEGGMATFTLDFVEPGEPVVTETRSDTAALAAAQADLVEEAAPARFAASFSVASMPAFVENAAADLVHRVAAVAADIGLSLGGGGGALRAFEIGLTTLTSGAIALVRSPLALGNTILGLVRAVAGIATPPIARVAALRRLMADGVAFAPVIGATPVRNQQRANQTAFARLVVAIAAAEAVRACAGVRFASYDEAVSLRDGLQDDLDRAAMVAADAGDDASAEALDSLRLIMVRDVTARGGSLERLHNYVPGVTEPALVIARRLYADTAIVIDRADELATRNRIRHPGFVPGGHALSVRGNG
jgi:prophage DNA circulation protein